MYKVIPIDVIIVACILLSLRKNPATLLGPISRKTPAIIAIYRKHSKMSKNKLVASTVKKYNAYISEPEQIPFKEKHYPH